MRYAQIRKMDVVNGKGIGTALYTQGCPIHCEGCFNKDIWDFEGGKAFTENEIETIIDLSSKNYITRLSILGGEPLIDQNLEDLSNLIIYFKDIYPDKEVWIYSGYLFKQLEKESKTNDKMKAILDNIDYLIDGPYIHSKRDVTLKWRGSSNQHIWHKVKGKWKKEE